MMVGNAEKGQKGKFFIQFLFSFPFSSFPTPIGAPVIPRPKISS